MTNSTPDPSSSEDTVSTNASPLVILSPDVPTSARSEKDSRLSDLSEVTIDPTGPATPALPSGASEAPGPAEALATPASPVQDGQGPLNEEPGTPAGPDSSGRQGPPRARTWGRRRRGGPREALQSATTDADPSTDERAAPATGTPSTQADLATQAGPVAPTEKAETGQEEHTPVRRPSSRRERLTKGADETPDISFMHPSEQEFAKLLDFYHVHYLYEPRSFPLRWEGERVVEMFTPDFYLPVQDQYVELTTMKQNLVTQKNRKLRRVRELYPEVSVMLLYRRDIMRLLAKYGFGPLAEAEVKGVDRILFSAQQIQQRVQQLGAQVTQDYQGQEIVLIGVLRGVVCFMADLMRHISLPLHMDFMEIARYGSDEGSPSNGGRASEVTVTKDAPISVEGRHVILVEDIVDTGMTLQFLLRHLWAKRPASVAVCTLLNKQVRRMNEVPIKYCGFEIPDEFVVGYGLDFQGLYRNLPDICVLKPVEPKVEPQQ